MESRRMATGFCWRKFYQELTGTEMQVFSVYGVKINEE